MLYCSRCSALVQLQSVFDFEKRKGRQVDESIVRNFPESKWRKAGTGGLKQQHSANINVRDILSDLKSCTKKRDLQKGRKIHIKTVQARIDSNIYVAGALINLYAKCGSMVDAMTVFDRIDEPNVVCWNALILGYADHGQGLVALDWFSRMKSDGRCAPDSWTYVAALKACTLLAADGGAAGKADCLERGKRIHWEIDCHINHFVHNTLINLYGKCGSMEDARKLFDSIQEPNVVSWTALILGYAENGQGLVAFDLFYRMKKEGRCTPNSLTYIAALKACTLLAADVDEDGKLGCLKMGVQLHSDVGCHMDGFVQSTLINLYARCGNMEYARTVFNSIIQPDVVSWTALILGYADNGQSLVAIDLFTRMKDEGRCAPNTLTYVAALKACTSLAANGDEAEKQALLKRGRQMHSEIGFNIDHISQNTLINLYAKCGSMEDARTLFDSIQEPNVVSWTALIMGYVENGQSLVALDLFYKMEGRCAPNSVTYVAALMACCSIGALATGQRIHSVIKEFDPQVLTCLVDFYAKCGIIEEACEVFHLHPRARDVSTWNALLAGYARFGDNVSVFRLFEAMQDQGFQPNAVTFLCVLSCCSHAGMIAKAWQYLEVMTTRYRITPNVMHYNCMIDLLGRANKLDEAVALLEKMPCDPNAVTWKTLLGACRKWKNLDIGRWAFKSLMDLDQNNASAYVLMAEIYGSRGMWDEQERLLETKMQFGAYKLPEQAYVMDGLGRMVEFVVGEEDLVAADVDLTRAL